jgi:nicotinamidase-related amidase
MYIVFRPIYAARMKGGAMTEALILIDLQNDYFPGGRMELEGSIEAGHKAGKILAYFRENRLPLIHVQHISSRPGATFLEAGTPGIEIHESVKPAEGELIVRKHFPNSFRNTSLLEHLRAKNIDSLIITGMMTNMCVDATVRAAFDYEFKSIVLSDACANRSLLYKDIEIPAAYVHAAFIASLIPIYAKVLTVDEYLS